MVVVEEGGGWQVQPRVLSREGAGSDRSKVPSSYSNSSCRLGVRASACVASPTQSPNYRTELPPTLVLCRLPATDAVPTTTDSSALHQTQLIT